MARKIVTLNLKRINKDQPWGFRFVGGTDIPLILKVDKVHGIGTPAGKADLQANDAIKYVDDKDVTDMTHDQVVQLIKNHRDLEMKIIVERGEHVIPSISDAFPVTTEIEEIDKLAYYEQAMKKGLGGFIMPDSFTCVGKFKVKTPKYNSPRDMYSDQTMDDMICGSGNVDESKLEPDSPAYVKFKNSKRFDPAQSDVVKVLSEQEKDIGIPFDENGDGDIDSDDENPQGRRKQSKNLRPKSARKSGAPNTPPIRGEVDPGPSPGPTQQSEPRTRKDSIHSSCEQNWCKEIACKDDCTELETIRKMSSEVSKQKSEIHKEKSKDSKQKNEDSIQKREDSKQRSDDSKQKSEAPTAHQKTENTKQKSDNTKQKSDNSKQKSKISNKTKSVHIQKIPVEEPKQIRKFSTEGAKEHKEFSPAVMEKTEKEPLNKKKVSVKMEVTEVTYAELGITMENDNTRKV